MKPLKQTKTVKPFILCGLDLAFELVEGNNPLKDILASGLASTIETNILMHLQSASMTSVIFSLFSSLHARYL